MGPFKQNVHNYHKILLNYLIKIIGNYWAMPYSILMMYILQSYASLWLILIFLTYKMEIKPPYVIYIV